MGFCIRAKVSLTAPPCMQAVAGCSDVRALSTMPRFSYTYTLTLETSAPPKQQCVLPGPCLLCMGHHTQWQACKQVLKRSIVCPSLHGSSR